MALSDTRLITVSDITARMGLPDNVDRDDFVNSAIEGAQQRIASILRTEINLTSGNVDMFFLDERANSAMQRNGLFRLLLRKGFVLASPAPVIEYSPAWRASVADWQTLPAGDLMADWEQGIVSIDAETYVNQYVRVTYDAGYAAGDTLPAWLKECIVGYTPIMFDISSTTNRDPEAEAGYKVSADHACKVAERKARSLSLILRPM